jgi:hypothetical protein
MHYTTIDPQKDKIRTQDHTLPSMHYTTIDHEGRNILSVMISRYVPVHFNTLPGSHNAISWFQTDLTAS